MFQIEELGICFALTKRVSFVVSTPLNTVISFSFFLSYAVLTVDLFTFFDYKQVIANVIRKTRPLNPLAGGLHDKSCSLPPAWGSSKYPLGGEIRL